MNSVNILSGGAAQGLVASFAGDFKARTGFEISGEFGAVGAMADKLRSGAPTDLIILTAALVARLADEGLVVPASITDVGTVETALAVRSGDPLVSIRTADELRAAFLAADAIFVPDIKTSTAGIHVANLLQQLSIAESVAARLQVYPNGATAMRHLAASTAARPIGCTQSTEIISTKGVELSGALPPGCELKTMYTAAITTQAKSPAEAKMLIDLLTSPEAHAARGRAGFVG
jgi:molybdate transport system substrate-binding protein